MAIGACLFALAPVLAVATLLRSALQSLVLRWGGDLHLVLEGEALRITTSPRLMREVSVARHATLEARRSGPSECQLVVVDEAATMTLSAPLDADDARYVVALVAAYRAENASPRPAHL